MIWDILQESSFNDYFSQSSLPTLTPQKLLLDENIITEFKNLNPKLIEYLEEHYDEFLSRLIEYTIKLPTQTDGQDRVRKLPYVSSEVLAIDNESVYKAFFDWEKNYFQELMGIFDTDAKDNQILAGYFVKIIQNLYKCQKKKTAQKIYAFRQTFYQNLDKESVATVFKLCLVLLQTEEGFMLNQRKQIIQKLIESFVNGNENIKIVCKNVLLEVISKFQTFSSGDQLLNEIMKSQTLMKIFQIKESDAVDDFLVGYMTKALQKICTSGQQKKSLLQISEEHKSGIKNYIILKKKILNNTEILGSGFQNQSRTKVYRLDKKVTLLLSLIKLTLENGIVGFLAKEDIETFFVILSLHPSNDIIKVKIFDIFTFIYTKKDIQAQEIFGKYFFNKAIELYEQDKKMFRYFLFQLWRSIGKRISKEHLEGKDEAKWAELIKYFEVLENYEKQAHKVVERYSNLTKVTKLVVDEEDTVAVSISNENPSSNTTSQKETPNLSIQEISQNEKITTKIQTKQNSQSESQNTNTKDPFSFDFFAPAPNSVQSKSQTKIEAKVNKVDPFASFDFFTPATTKPQDTKKQENKKADFNDFSSFF